MEYKSSRSTSSKVVAIMHYTILGVNVMMAVSFIYYRTACKIPIFTTCHHVSQSAPSILTIIFNVLLKRTEWDIMTDSHFDPGLYFDHYGYMIKCRDMFRGLIKCL